jgi:hypothetical protein
MAGGAGVYVGGGATVIMDPPPAVYVKVFHEGSGPARHLGRKADAVAIMARSLVPVKTGRLASTIHVDRNRNEQGRYTFGYRVYASTPYAYFVHEGTGPSPRWPDSRKVMKWPGSRADIAYRDFVMHPGTPSQPFLQNALVAMAG